MIERRAFLTGLGAMFAAPAIVRASSLMPIRGAVLSPIGTYTHIASYEYLDGPAARSAVALFKQSNDYLKALNRAYAYERAYPERIAISPAWITENQAQFLSGGLHVSIPEVAA